MTFRVIAGLLGASAIVGVLGTAAAESQKAEWRQDAQLRAMSDELTRSRTLQLGSFEKPYFIQYSSEDLDQMSVAASLDGLTHISRFHLRQPNATVRVGSYAFDNANSVYSRNMRFALLPVDDDYGVMRTSLWRMTDALYKGALKQLTGKRNALREISDPDKTADLASAKPLQMIEPVARPAIDGKAWERAVKDASARFIAHPAVMTSSVQAQVIGGMYRMINSEGTILRVPESLGVVQIRASSRTADGYRVWNHAYEATADLRRLPRPDEIAKLAETVATETEALSRVPLAEDYSGPVLFEGEASAAMMAEVLTDSVILRRKPVAPPGANGAALQILDSVWSSRIGAKVAPEWLSAFDDPLAKEYRGHELGGHYTVDEEGVPAERVQLVDKGTFKGFLLSRVPVRKWSGSNGHGRLPGPFGSEQAVIGNLFIQATQALTEAQLKARLLEKVKAAGLKYGLIVRRIDFPSTAALNDLQGLARQAQNNGYARTLNQPLLTYRVSLDGREELVRGLRFREFSAKDLRDVDAASDQPYVLNYSNNGSSLNIADVSSDAVISSVICPSLLFVGVDLARAENEGGAAPVVPPPSLVAKQ